MPISGFHIVQSSLSNRHRAKEKSMRTYQEVVDYLLHTYATDEVTIKTDAALGRYSKSPQMSLIQYAEASMTDSSRSGETYD